MFVVDLLVILIEFSIFPKWGPHRAREKSDKAGGHGQDATGRSEEGKGEKKIPT